MKFCIVGAGAIGGCLAARLALAGEEVTVVARGTGGFDGITRSSSGRIFVSSQSGRSVLELINNRFTRVIDNLPSPGDIGYDTRRDRLLIPLLNEGRVEIWELGK